MTDAASGATMAVDTKMIVAITITQLTVITTAVAGTITVMVVVIAGFSLMMDTPNLQHCKSNMQLGIKLVMQLIGTVLLTAMY